MKLLTLLPILGVNVPPALMSVGLRMLQVPGVFTPSGFDIDLAIAQLPTIVKDDPTVTKAIVKLGLQGMGVAPAAAELATTYAFDSNGERTDAETEHFTQQFRFLNSPQGRIELPFGCKSCNRIHYSLTGLQLSSDGNPLCARCSREIPLLS